VALNLRVDAMREHQRQWSGRDAMDRPELAHRDPAPGPELRLLEQERRRQLRREILHLPALERECIHLKARGMTYREIAARLRIPMSAAVDCVRRAVKKLRANFDPPI
jgi:RNA polymerase sigma factor (sigma-70 family)